MILTINAADFTNTPFSGQVAISPLWKFNIGANNIIVGRKLLQSVNSNGQAVFTGVVSGAYRLDFIESDNFNGGNITTINIQVGSTDANAATLITSSIQLDTTLTAYSKAQSDARYYPLSNPSGFGEGGDVDTSNFVTKSQTGQFYAASNPSGFITASQTGLFYPASNPSGYITGAQGNFYPASNPSGFITSGQTGQFVTSGQTGQFVTTGQTGKFVTTGQTGQFVTTGQTGRFLTTGQSGLFIASNGGLAHNAVGVTVADFGNKLLFNDSNTQQPTLDWQNSLLLNFYSAQTQTSLDWVSGLTYDSTSVLSVNWFNRLLTDSNGFESVDWANKQLSNVGNITLDWQNCSLTDTSNFQSADWNNRALVSSNITTLDWQNCFLADTNDIQSIDWQGRTLSDTEQYPAVYWDFRELMGISGDSISVNWGTRVAYDDQGVTSYDWQNRILTGGWKADVFTASQYSGIQSVNSTLTSGTAKKIDCSVGNTWKYSLTGNTTFNLANSYNTMSLKVALVNTGTYTVSWPSGTSGVSFGVTGVKWQNNSVPVQTTGNHTDIYTFVQIDNTIYGSAQQNF